MCIVQCGNGEANNFANRLSYKALYFTHTKIANLACREETNSIAKTDDIK